MIKQSSIDNVLSAVRIEDVVGDFVSLKRQGRDFVGICPFHDDKNPSMHVSPRLGIYKCFVCDAAGNAVKFLMEHEKMSYPEAIEYLGKKYGVPIEYTRAENEEEARERSLRESLFVVNEFAQKYFMEQLRTTEEGKLIAMAYLKERGFMDSTIDKFKLGYCPDGWDNFTQEALKNGYKEEYLIELGLTGKSQSGKLYDIYRGRVIFPIHNDAGRIIGFGGRILKKDTKDPRKYVNSRENTIYHKSDTLYGIFFAKNAIHKNDNVYLVEGYTDVISMHESGIENVVASSGTSLTTGQIRLISRRTRNITVLYDGDMAGIKASMRGIDMLLEHDLKIRVCLLPDGEDPDSFAKKHRDSELFEYLNENSKDFVLFKADILSQEAGNDPIKRATMVNEILKSISCIKDGIVRAFYVKECAKMFALSEADLNLNLNKYVWKKINEQSKINVSNQQIPQIADIVQQIPQEQGIVDSSNISDIGKIDLLFEAEKDIISLVLNFGDNIIYVPDDDNQILTPTRIDQFICDQIEIGEISFHYDILKKIFEQYAETASYVYDREQIMKNFTNSEDIAISDFVIKNFIKEEPKYSDRWKEKFDQRTHTVRNNIELLQNYVKDVVLTHKLRVLEDCEITIRKNFEDAGLSPENADSVLSKLNTINSSKKQISILLKRIVSK